MPLSLPLSAISVSTSIYLCSCLISTPPPPPPTQVLNKLYFGMLCDFYATWRSKGLSVEKGDFQQALETTNDRAQKSPSSIILVGQEQLWQPPHEVSPSLSPSLPPHPPLPSLPRSRSPLPPSLSFFLSLSFSLSLSLPLSLARTLRLILTLSPVLLSPPLLGDRREVRGGRRSSWIFKMHTCFLNHDYIHTHTHTHTCMHTQAYTL
jgi:hypothetical protein